MGRCEYRAECPSHAVWDLPAVPIELTHQQTDYFKESIMNTRTTRICLLLVALVTVALAGCQATGSPRSTYDDSPATSAHCPSCG
jgi:hypothetical protein